VSGIDIPKIDAGYFPSDNAGTGGGGGGGGGGKNQNKRDRAIAEIKKLRKQRDQARRMLAKAKRARSKRQTPAEAITARGLGLPIVIGGAILAIVILSTSQKR